MEEGGLGDGGGRGKENTLTIALFPLGPVTL